MQKWEYLRLSIVYAAKVNEVIANGEEIYNRLGKDKYREFNVTAYFQELGAEGWELVSSTLTQSTEFHHFKRPIE
jgi:hypothetical protein